MQTNRIGLLIISLFVAVVAYAQTPSVTAPVVMTASVTGQIKIGETPARGVSVALMLSNRQRNPQLNPQTDPTTRVTTDADGRYRFTNLAAGTYRVNILSPGYIIFGTSDLVRNGQQVMLKDGEAVERIDFTLTRGGVITGKVVNSNNRPVIGEGVTLMTIDDAGQQTPFNPPNGGGGMRTDDRGVYRVYGLPPGKYLVSAGQGDGRGGGPGFMAASRSYLRTYHPEVTDVTQATPITVEAGKEVTEVDIRLVSLETFAAAGRVVDATTGNPVVGVLIGHSSVRGGGRGGQMQAPGGPGSTDGTSGEEGVFRIEGLARGRYSVYVAQDSQNPATSEYYSEPATFEIATTDVTGLEIKLQRGASVTGTVVVDGSNDPNVLANIRVNAMVRGNGAGGGMGGGGRANNSAQVSSNGLFRVSGLAPGRVNLNVNDANNPGPFSGLQVLRIEKDGADLQSGLEVAQGEAVMGVRVVVAYGNSTIRGIVRVEGGTLTPDLRLMVTARRTDAPNGGGGGGGRGGGFGGGGVMPGQVDANGQFQISQLVAGTYEVTVQAMPGGFGGGFGGPGGGVGGGPGGGGFGGRGGGQPQGQPPGQPTGQTGQPVQMMRAAPVTQTVVVGNNATQNVTMTLNLANQVPMTFGNQPGQPGNRQGNPQGNPPNNPARRRP